MSKSSNFGQLSILVIVLLGGFMFIHVCNCSATTIYGDIVESNSARGLAMGAASIVVADGSIAHLSNPAALILVPKSAILGGVNFDQVSEESFYEDKQNLDNSQTYFNPLRSQGFVIKNGEAFTGALSRGMLFDYYTKQEAFDEKTKASSSYESKGGLYSFSALAAKQVVPRMAIGGSVNVLRGNVNAESRYTFGKITSSVTYENTASGMNISLGGLYIVNEQFTIGAVYRTSAEITEKLTNTTTEAKKTNTVSSRVKWTYPSSMGIGGSYKNNQMLMVGEIHRTNWSDFESQEAGGALSRPGYVDLTTYHVGLEYGVPAPSMSPDPVLLRIGFYTCPLHFLEELSTDETTGYFLTMGAGISAGEFKLDIAGQFGKKTFTEMEGNSDYEASIKSVLGTIRYQFDLF